METGPLFSLSNLPPPPGPGQAGSIRQVCFSGLGNPAQQEDIEAAGPQEADRRCPSWPSGSGALSEAPSPPRPSLGHVGILRGLSVLGFWHKFPVLCQLEYLKISG